MATNGTGVQFHVGLHVADRQRSTAFYRVLLGVAPVKEREDQVRFELSEPPLILVLVPSPQQPGGALNHLGLRLRNATELVAVQRRLEEAGLTTQRQDGVECCYARQSKFWITDPDSNLWEIYTLEEDLDHSGFEDGPHAVKIGPAPAAVWEHRLTEQIPDRIDRADGSVAAVRFEGTLNSEATPEQIKSLLSEVRRILEPGGQLAIHGLVADRAFPGAPDLPGLASLVRHVPTWEAVAARLEEAGFGGIFFEKLGDIHCFRVNGIELREMRLLAVRPHDDPGATEQVLYKGPFDQCEDDEGNLYRRGEKVAVTSRMRGLLQGGPAAGQFLFLPASKG